MPPADPPVPDPSHGHLFGSSDHADSAGLPWEGRRFEQNSATGDDGAADPALLDALTTFTAASGTVEVSAASSDEGTSADPVAVVEAFRRGRLLIPLVAHAGDVGHTEDGHLVDKTQELAIATVQAPDGRAVLPAFTSVATLQAWNPRARPVPAAGPRVALAAASENTELVVIDPTSPTEFVLRRPALRALATGGAWEPPWSNHDVRTAFAESVAEESQIVGLELAAGDPAHRLRAAEVEVALTLVDGLDAAALSALVGRVTERWGRSQLIADRVDSLAVRLRPL